MPEAPSDRELELELTESRRLSERANRAIPGGVHSYARKFDVPINFEYGSGSTIHDVDGNTYIDYLNAWGAIILGHCHEPVNDAAAEISETQDLFGFGTTELQVDVAETINQLVPSAEKTLFGITGSEVTARAAHVARGVTGRDKIIKFQGHYHGWYDSYAVNFQGGEDDLGTVSPFTDGLNPGSVDQTIVLPFNDIDAVDAAIGDNEDEIAGVILEPVAHNMGCVLPEDGYLEELRRVTRENGILLIFDEIITGFRHGMGGIQERVGVTPDLTTLGKSVANGFPISVLCGKSKYMDSFTTAGGNVSYGGTYNAHPASLAAASETISILQSGDFHAIATQMSERIANAFEEIIADHDIPATVAQFGPTFLTYFQEDPPRNYRDVLENDEAAYEDFRWKMIEQGILFVPKNARRNYLTASHTGSDVEATIEAAKYAFAAIADEHY